MGIAMSLVIAKIVILAKLAGLKAAAFAAMAKIAAVKMTGMLMGGLSALKMAGLSPGLWLWGKLKMMAGAFKFLSHAKMAWGVFRAVHSLGGAISGLPSGKGKGKDKSKGIGAGNGGGAGSWNGKRATIESGLAGSTLPPADPVLLGAWSGEDAGKGDLSLWGQPDYVNVTVTESVSESVSEKHAVAMASAATTTGCLTHGHRGASEKIRACSAVCKSLIDSVKDAETSLLEVGAAFPGGLDHIWCLSNEYNGCCMGSGSWAEDQLQHIGTSEAGVESLFCSGGGSAGWGASLTAGAGLGSMALACL